MNRTTPPSSGAVPAIGDAVDRRALLKSLLEARSPPISRAAFRPDRAARHTPFPLTDLQRAYWLGRDPAFPLGGVGIHGYFELDCERLDLQRLEWAWNQVIARHDMMRCVVTADGMARILAEVPFYTIAYDDLSQLGEAERARHLAKLRERLSHQVFDPGRWPVFELRACRLDATITRLLISEDAIHLDLASSEIVTREWLAIYAGKALPPPPDLSFRDIVVAGALRRPEGPSAGDDVGAELPDPPSLPPRPDGGPARMIFHRRNFMLSNADWAVFKARAAEHDLTPSGALLAAYAEVLGRWADAPQFLLNVTVQNRPDVHPDLSRMAGDFTDFALVEIDLSHGESLASQARRHRDALWRALEDPARRGVAALRQFGAGRRREFSVVPFVYTSSLGTAGYRVLRELGRVTYEVTQTPQVLIDQQVLELDGELHLSWDSVDGAFAPGVVEAMFEVLCGRLRALVAGERAWTDGTPLPLPAAQIEARRELNATSAPVREARLETLFDIETAARPGGVALIDDAGEMTYAELDAASRALAAALLPRLPAEPDTPVLIWLPKGRSQVLAVLAVLRTGHPYIAIDPATPAHRLAAMLTATKTAAAIVDRRAGLPDPPDLDHRLLIDVEEKAAGPPRPRRWSKTAYILFTSGSTGVAKGVPITHRAAVNRIDDVVQRFALVPEDRALALTALHHDLSVFDLFAMMAAGGAIVFPSRGGTGPGDPRIWLRCVAESRVTLWNSVPAFLEMLLALPPAELRGRLSSLRLVMMSGDRVPSWIPERLRSLSPTLHTVSLGGPTETTVWDVCFDGARLPPGWRDIPYGRPMRNARYFVRRLDGSECPDWVPGELWIAGEGVSPGYIGGSAEDRALFHTDMATGERVFRSGDLGRIRPDGLIEFLGRTDRMVKLRGHRVELGAVEAELRSLPEVGRACAFIVEAPGGRNRLAAAVTPKAADYGGEATRLAIPALQPESRVSAGRRVSALSFSGAPMAAADLAAFLSVFCDEPHAGGGSRRCHPSAGAKYSVRVSLLLTGQRVAGLRQGFYRLDPCAGMLERVDGSVRLPPDAHAPRNQGLARDAAATIILTCASRDLAEDYGGAWRDLALLEAGYMGQLAMMHAASLGLAICPLGGLELPDDFPLCEGEAFIHALLLGPAPGQEWACGAWPAGSAQRLEAALASRLAPHARPSLLLVDAMPLTRNGKPDVEALAALCAARDPAPTFDTAPVPVAAPSVAVLEQALRSVLGRDDFRRECNFQELGLFSADLVRLHTRLVEAGFELSIADLFHTPTVAALSDRLSGASDTESASRRGALRRARLKKAKPGP